MSKDPAFLFYSKDWITSTSIMPFEDRGKYITILSVMHQQGRLSEETIRFMVGSFSDILKSKFKIDDNGLWFNERLEIEIDKRQSFVESRRENGKNGGRPRKPSAKPLGYASAKATDNLVAIANEDVNESNSLEESEEPLKVDFMNEENLAANNKLSQSYIDNIQKGEVVMWNGLLKLSPSLSKPEFKAKIIPILMQFQDHLNSEGLVHVHFGNFRKHFHRWYKKTI